MDLIFKNTTFSLKIDWYRRASTVHHGQNKQKLGKVSSFFSTRRVRKGLSALLAQAGKT